MNKLEKLYNKNIQNYSQKYIDYLHDVLNKINFQEIDNVSLNTFESSRKRIQHFLLVMVEVQTPQVILLMICHLEQKRQINGCLNVSIN